MIDLIYGVLSLTYIYVAFFVDFLGCFSIHPLIHICLWVCLLILSNIEFAAEGRCSILDFNKDSWLQVSALLFYLMEVRRKLCTYNIIEHEDRIEFYTIHILICILFILINFCYLHFVYKKNKEEIDAEIDDEKTNDNYNQRKKAKDYIKNAIKWVTLGLLFLIAQVVLLLPIYNWTLIASSEEEDVVVEILEENYVKKPRTRDYYETISLDGKEVELFVNGKASAFYKSDEVIVIHYQSFLRIDFWELPVDISKNLSPKVPKVSLVCYLAAVLICFLVKYPYPEEEPSHHEKMDNPDE